MDAVLEFWSFALKQDPAGSWVLNNPVLTALWGSVIPTPVGPQWWELKWINQMQNHVNNDLLQMV